MKENFLMPQGLYYKTNEFKANRETLLFVHGLSGSSSAWWEYEPIFENKYNLVFFDLRGHGQSKKYQKYEDYEMEKFVKDLEALVAHLKLDKFIIIGHSFGSLIVLEYLLRHEDKLRAAILLSPSTAVYNRFLAKVLKPMLSLVRLAKLFSVSAKTGGHIDYKNNPQSGDWDLKAIMKDVRNTTLPIYLYCTEQSYSMNFEKRVAGIKIPVLLVHGRADSIFPVQNSYELHKGIKNSSLLIIDKADHIIARNNVPEICQAVESFIKKL